MSAQPYKVSISQTQPETLSRILGPARPVRVVDIGANPIDGVPPYVPLLREDLCEVVGFEPQAEALATLERNKGPHERYLPYVVGDGTPAVLKTCYAPGMTSLLEPDAPMLQHFAGFPQWGAVVRRQEVQTRRLDDIEEVPQFDFLKIDIQGSELAVFRNGRQKLAGAVAVQTEVSFLTLYKDQPTIGDIDHELRGLGFVPHAFATINRRMIAPLRDSKNVHAALHQLLEGDMVYVRNFTQPSLMSDEQLKHLALIAHYCYRSFDLAAICLRYLAERSSVGANALQRYLATLPVR